MNKSLNTSGLQSTYQAKICRILIRQSAKYDKFDDIITTLFNSPTFKRLMKSNKETISANNFKRPFTAPAQVIKHLFNMLDKFEYRIKVQQTVLKYLFLDYITDLAIDIEVSYNLTKRIDDLLCRGSYFSYFESFHALLKEALYYTEIVVTENVVRQFEFKEYHRNFTILGTILKSDTKYNFFTAEERQKHFAQLLKTANYKTTKDWRIRYMLEDKSCKNAEEQEALESILFLKTLAE